MPAVAPAPLTLPLPSSNKQQPTSTTTTTTPTANTSLELTRGSSSPRGGSSSPRSLPRLAVSPYAVPAPRPRTPRTPRSARSPRSPRSARTEGSGREEEGAVELEHIESEDETQSGRAEGSASAAAGEAGGGNSSGSGSSGGSGSGRQKGKAEQLKENARRRRHNKVHPSIGQPSDLTPPSASSGRSVIHDGQQHIIVNKSPFSSSTQTSSTLSSSSSSSHNHLSPAVPPLVALQHPPSITASTTPDSLSASSASFASSAASNAPPQPAFVEMVSPPVTSLTAVPAAGGDEAVGSGGVSQRHRPRWSIAIPVTPVNKHSGTAIDIAGTYTPQPSPPQAPLTTTLITLPTTTTTSSATNTARHQPPTSSSSPRTLLPALPIHSQHTTTTVGALRTARALPVLTAVMSPWTLRFQSIDQRTGRPLLATPASRSQTSGVGVGGAPLYRTSTGVMRESLETLFLSHYFHKYNTSNRVSIVISTVIWALFVINDALKELATERKDFYPTVALRGADCIIGLLIAVALGSKWLHARHLAHHSLYEQLLMYAGMTAFGVSQILFGVWQQNTLDPTYSMFMILIPSMAPTFLHQRFLFTCAFSIMLVPMFIILTLATGSYTSTATNSSIASTFVGITMANAFFCLFAYRREKSLREDFLSARQLEAEEKKSQALLNNMMPVSAVAKLRAGAEYIYNKHEDVTILFSHIAEFDDYTARLPPHRLVAFLNDLFYAFDQLTDELQVYKVETIGDVFLVCSNCPVEYARDDHDHAAIMCVMALAMMDVVREMKAIDGDVEGGEGGGVRLKLGIHTGEVIAGVVGAKYPRFRLMGDTVNTASRMSTTTPANSIQLSPATHLLISEKRASDGTPAFTCRERGPTPIKGKGNIHTHFLLAHKYEHSRTHHTINTRRWAGGNHYARANTIAGHLTPRDDSDTRLDAQQADAAELAGEIRTRAQRIKKGLTAMQSHSPETHAEWGEDDGDGMLASRTPSFRHSQTASMASSPVRFHNRAESSGRPQSVDMSQDDYQTPEEDDEDDVEDSLKRTADVAAQSVHSPSTARSTLSQHVTPRTAEPTGRRLSNNAGLSSRAAAQPAVAADSAMPVAVFHLGTSDLPPSPLPSVATAAQLSPRVASIRQDVPRLPISNGNQSPTRRRLQLRSTSNLPTSPLAATRNISADSQQQVEPQSAQRISKASATSSASTNSVEEEDESEDDSGVAAGGRAALRGGHSRALTSDSSGTLDLTRGNSAADTTATMNKASHHSTTSFAAPSITQHTHNTQPSTTTDTQHPTTTTGSNKKQTRWDSSVAPDRHALALATPDTHATDLHTPSPHHAITDRITLPVSSSTSTLITIQPSPMGGGGQRAGQHEQYVPMTPSPGGGMTASSPTASSSKRDSGDQQKLLITATNDTVKMDKLFKLGPTQSILRPKGRRAWDYFTQRFITEPELEQQFQTAWAARMTPTSRFWVLFCVLAFIPLSVYETVINLSRLSGSPRLTIESWLVRLCGVLLGFAYAWCTYRPFYQRWMQSITSVVLWVEGALFIYMAIEFHDYDTSYGIGVMLILLCIVHMFVGLRFSYALLCSVGILLFYVVATRLASAVPAVIVMVVAGNVIYAESNYWGEFLARQDYIRRLKRENEKVRTQQFLDNMLPPLVLTMIKQGNIVAHHHAAADVIFCDIVGFTSIASALPAEDVVAVLNVMFSTYDALSTLHAVYKVETIGDCWMGCCGVVSHETNHTQNIVDFALAMIKSTRGFRVQTDQAKITAAAFLNVDKLQAPQRVEAARQTVTERKMSEADDKERAERERTDSKTSVAGEPISVLNGGTTALGRSSMSFMMGSPASPPTTSSATNSLSPNLHEPLSATSDTDVGKPTLTRLGSAASTTTSSQSERESVKGHPLVVRIGIHSGPVIAGVVGRKCARYHLFGETVTVAEEMEQHGQPGKVVISELTRQSMVAGMTKEQIKLYELEPISPLVRPEPTPPNSRLARTVTTASTTPTAGPATPPLPRVLHRYIVRRASTRHGQRSKVQSTVTAVHVSGGGGVGGGGGTRGSLTVGGLASVTHAGGGEKGSLVNRSRRVALDAVVV